MHTYISATVCVRSAVSVCECVCVRVCVSVIVVVDRNCRGKVNTERERESGLVAANYIGHWQQSRWGVGWAGGTNVPICSPRLDCLSGCVRVCVGGVCG